MDIETFLSHFSSLRKTSNGWQAKCPSHEDKKASIEFAKKHINPPLYLFFQINVPFLADFIQFIAPSKNFWVLIQFLKILKNSLF